jgi:DNA-nicking Smr family endonuclease
MLKSKHYKNISVSKNISPNSLKDISTEELELFRNTVDDSNSFKVLDKDKLCQSNNSNKLKNNKFLKYRIITDGQHSGSDKLFYNNGVSLKIIKQMQKGNINPCASMDLHGQTMEEACLSLASFIYYHQNKDYLHIIHGKGYNSGDSNNMSKLKTQVYTYLKDHPQISAFCSTPQHFGGTGAVFAKLKKN